MASNVKRSKKNGFYKVGSRLWKYQGAGAWYFLSVAPELALQIRERYKGQSRGWSSLPVLATIDSVSWNTSIFYDRKSESYLLPVKAKIRRDAEVVEGDEVDFWLQILV